MSDDDQISKHLDAGDRKLRKEVKAIVEEKAQKQKRSRAKKISQLRKLFPAKKVQNFSDETYYDLVAALKKMSDGRMKISESNLIHFDFIEKFGLGNFKRFISGKPQFLILNHGKSGHRKLGRSATPGDWGFVVEEEQRYSLIIFHTGYYDRNSDYISFRRKSSREPDGYVKDRRIKSRASRTVITLNHDNTFNFRRESLGYFTIAGAGSFDYMSGRNGAGGMYLYSEDPFPFGDIEASGENLSRAEIEDVLACIVAQEIGLAPKLRRAKAFGALKIAACAGAFLLAAKACSASAQEYVPDIEPQNQPTTELSMN